MARISDIMGHMKPLKCLGWLGFGLLALTSLVCAEEQNGMASPYQTIVDRNAFNLKAPVIASEKTEPPPPPMAKVVLTGVTSMMNSKRALLEIEEAQAGKGNNKKSIILREGEREGSVEVMDIDVEHATVKIKNNGFETNLIFEVKKETAPPVTPGMPIPGRPMVGVPGFNPAAANPNGVFPGVVPQQPIPLPGGATPGGPTIIGRDTSGKPNPYGTYGTSVPGVTGVGITPSGTTPSATTPTLPTRYYRITPPVPK